MNILLNMPLKVCKCAKEPCHAQVVQKTIWGWGGGGGGGGAMGLSRSALEVIK